MKKSAVASSCLAGVIIAFVATLGGLLWNVLAKPRHVWTPEQAAEYEAASTELHKATMPHDDQGKPRVRSASDAAQVEAARERFDRIRTQLERAQFNKDRLGSVLTQVGLAAAAAFGIGYLASRERS